MTVQSSNTNRAVGIRQTESFGAPGASIAFRLSKTVGWSDFTWSIDAGLLSVQPRNTTWTFQYGIGTSPTSFTPLRSISPSEFGLQSQVFGPAQLSAINNVNDVVWLRVVALEISTSSGNRDTFAVDNFSLSYTAVPEPSSFLLTAIATWLPFQLSRNRRRAKVTAC